MSLESNMPKVTFLLDDGIAVKGWTVTLEAATLDIQGMSMVRDILLDLLNQNVTVLRIELYDKGVQVWPTVASVLVV